MNARRTWIVQNDDGPVGQYITRRLTSIAADYRPATMVASAWRHEAPPEMLGKEPPLAIILGGSLSSTLQPTEWMELEYNLIQQAMESKVPLLGLCFGLQAMAEAMGGSVHRTQMARGPKAIVREKDSQLFRGISDWQFVATHEDQVHRMPRGFRRIATSDYCPVQCIQHESSPAFGFQFHPCYDAEASRVAALGLSVSQAYANPDGARLIRNFLELSNMHALEQFEPAI